MVYDGTNSRFTADGNQGAYGGVASMPVTSFVEYGSPDQGAIPSAPNLAQTGDRNLERPAG